MTFINALLIYPVRIRCEDVFYCGLIAVIHADGATCFLVEMVR